MKSDIELSAICRQLLDANHPKVYVGFSLFADDSHYLANPTL